MHPQLALHQARQRQAGGPPGSALNISPAGASKGGRYVQQRFSTVPTREPGDSSFYSATSPTKPVTFTSEPPFAAQQPQALTSSGTIGPYDPVASAAAVEEKLAAALRGMAVEDEYGLSQHQPNRISVPQTSNACEQPHTAASHARGHLPMQQPGAAHAAFSQPEFGYYNGPRVDYSYSFDAYRAPDPMFVSPALSPANAASLVYPGLPPRSLHSQSLAEVHALSPGVYYDFSGQNRPGFYYPTQPMAFQPPPMHLSIADSPLFNKKRGQVSIAFGCHCILDS